MVPETESITYMAAQPPSTTADSGWQIVPNVLRVTNLDPTVTNDVLRSVFGLVGDVISVTVCIDDQRSPLGYGYVNFSNHEDAARAINELNFTQVNGKSIQITYFNRDSCRAGNIFVKNLDKSIDDEELYDLFSVFGNVVSSKVQTESSGESKGHGFVQYDKEEAAQNAIKKNGISLYDKEIYIGPFIGKEEREKERSLGLNNLFIKNLDDSIDDDKLKKFFSQFGIVTSCKVNRDERGTSKGSGFVAFSTRDEASKAISVMNQKMVCGKLIYVAIAEKKEARTARLQDHFSQLQLTTSIAPYRPTSTPPSPRPGQQTLYKHAGPYMTYPTFMRTTGPVAMLYSYWGQDFPPPFPMMKRRVRGFSMERAYVYYD